MHEILSFKVKSLRKIDSFKISDECLLKLCLSLERVAIIEIRVITP
jgi:hypothetical protein